MKTFVINLSLCCLSSLRDASRRSNPTWLHLRRLLRCARNDGRCVMTYSTLIAMTMLGCNMLQNTKRLNTSEQVSAKTNLDVSQTGSSQVSRVSDSFVLTKDSADKVYTIRFWPKGKFNFSAEKGFEGEAEKVELNAWMKESNYKLNRQQTREKSDSNWKNTAVQKQEQKLLKKSGTLEKSASWKWIVSLAGIAAIIFIGIYLKIKIKKLWQYY